MFSDNAHQDIIAQTSHFVRRCVRLYFRPRTPTFFRNEGLRPLNAREDAHCPVPVAFLFDTASVLCLPEAQFSDGSLARRDAVLGRTAKEFGALPFDRIYHDRSLYGYDPADRDDIIFRRQAEVIIPNQLPLEGLLRYVFVRSPADLETLISLIGDSTAPSRMKKRPAFRVNTQSPLFFKRWSFVQRVFIANNHLSLVMNADTQTPGPFVARFDLFDQPAGRLLASDTRHLGSTANTIRQPIPAICHNQPFLVRFYLDDCLAYQNTLDPRQDITVSL